MQWILFLAVFASFLFLLSMIACWGFVGRHSAYESRILRVLKGEGDSRQGAQVRESFEGWISELSATIREKLGIHTGAKTISRLEAAGYRGSKATDVFFFFQWGLPAGGLFVGSFVRPNPLFWSFVGGVCGYLIPNMWVSQRTERRNEKIRRSLPDAIDLLVICVDAGLGLDQAILRVSEELGDAHPEVHQELVRVQLEQRAGRPRLESWQDLADRTGVKEMSEFVNMLTQTERFGTPVGKALSQFAEDMRLRRRQKAEEMAAKMKIKIIFPLVFCIFPCLFLVLLAPALIRMFDVFSGLKK